MNYLSVLRTINSTDPDTAYLVVADQNGKQQTIVSDSKHPYFAQYGADPTPPEPSPGKPYHGDIANAYWVNAANLEAGHKLIDDSGNWQTVVSVRVEQKPLNSYNLEIEHDHTFFIRGLGGDAGIWVHNQNCWFDITPDHEIRRIANQEVRTFNHYGREINVVQNPNWTPGKGPRYIEVEEIGGKLVYVNEGSPDIRRSYRDGRARDDKGNYTYDLDRPLTDYYRPNLTKETKEKILAKYELQPDGSYLRLSDNEIIEGPIDIGHKDGYEHRRLALAAHELKLSQKEFNEFVNAHPDYFRVENRSRNRSHVDEKPGSDELDSIKREIRKFKKERGIK